MFPDIVDIRAFYTSSLGIVAHKFISQTIETCWPTMTGLNLLGVGYPFPFLPPFDSQASEIFVLMPAPLGVIAWPQEGPSCTFLSETHLLPLPDSSIDRILLIHTLECVAHPGELLEELWRILNPMGKMLCIVPNRRGLWAQIESLPFGHGQPYSRRQLRTLLDKAQFSPISWHESLYCPPFEWKILLRFANFFEKMGGYGALPGAGVHIVEVGKQVYRPIPSRAMRLGKLPTLSPVVPYLQAMK